MTIEDPTPNQAVVDAMEAADLSATKLAELIGVQRQAVSIWRNNIDAVPRLQHRLAVAKVLHRPTAELWPTTGDGSLQISAVNEWPGVTQIPPGVWADLARNCSEHLDVCIGGSLYVAETLAPYLPIIVAAAAAGDSVQVRILGADPDGQQTAARQTNEAAHDQTIGGDRPDLATRGRQALDLWAATFDGVDDAEVRTTNEPEIFFGSGIVRFDSRMVVYHYLRGFRSLDGPVELISRADVGGRFDGLAIHLDRMWETGSPYPAN